MVLKFWPNATNSVDVKSRIGTVHVIDLLQQRVAIIIALWHTLEVVGVAINLLNPTGYVMHQQFNIQQLYALPTLYLCVLYLSENKQRLVPLTA
jgi:hypothetical protein